MNDETIGRRRTGAVILTLAILAAAPGCGGEPASAPATRDEASARSIRQGDLVGFTTERGAHAWRGIPYAAPPVGPLRWRAPRAPQPWEGTREALQHGAACVQFAGPLSPSEPGVDEGEPTGSEDCLFLNVYAPVAAPAEVPTGAQRLPVMVWIHGGGNTIGSSDGYDGSHLAHRRDLVVVTVNYRLGVFGWFAHAALHGPEDTPADRSGNYATLDLVRALEWVRDNVAAFGGDPDRVTIFGESAGGSNVYSLLVSPAAAGLFHRAISQSGGLSTSSMSDARDRSSDPSDAGDEPSSADVLEKLVADAGLASLPDEDVEAFLRGRSSSDLLGAYDGARLGGMYSIPRLLRDGVVLPAEEPMDLIRRGGPWNRVPTMLGTNRDENKLFMLGGSPDVARLFGLPLWLRNEERYELQAEYQSRMWKARGADEPAAAMRAIQGPSIYGYRFDWDEEPKILFADFSKLLGAAHGLEIPFVFGELRFPTATRLVFSDEARPAAEALSDAMMSYWAAFAYDGDPGRGRNGELPQWTAWDSSSPDAPRFMVLDSERDGGLRMASDSLAPAELIERAIEDPRFDHPRERCAVLFAYVRWSRVMSEEEYARVADGACGDYPLDDYPWQS